ncbi:MAG TPA: cobalamin-binding protein, partial [Gammaproteobacteria bacterium]|nr:cobalamin-binding protein [Gammaproteobacteria bacterium]
MIVLFLYLWITLAIAQSSQICVRDDAYRLSCLVKSTKRIVSLAPHATEVLFAIGAGEKIVGAVNYSDYPPAAKAIPRVGGYNNIDVERIVALRPDLVVAWSSGNNPAQVEALERLGIPVFRNEPRRVLDVAATARRLGRLAGTVAQAQRFARAFEARYRRLQETYAGRRPVRLFYEI